MSPKKSILVEPMNEVVVLLHFGGADAFQVGGTEFNTEIILNQLSSLGKEFSQRYARNLIRFATNTKT